MDFFHKGIHVTPSTIEADNIVKITYEGLLAEKGANEIYVHCGISNDLKNWENIKDIKMKKHNKRFYSDINVPKGCTFNMTFHDDANNWDNNGGDNYSMEINH